MSTPTLSPAEALSTIGAIAAMMEAVPYEEAMFICRSNAPTLKLCVEALRGEVRTPRERLWEHLHDEHKLALLESELDEIIYLAAEAALLRPVEATQ